MIFHVQAPLIFKATYSFSDLENRMFLKNMLPVMIGMIVQIQKSIYRIQELPPEISGKELEGKEKWWGMRRRRRATHDGWFV